MNKQKRDEFLAEAVKNVEQMPAAAVPKALEALGNQRIAMALEGIEDLLERLIPPAKTGLYEIAEITGGGNYIIKGKYGVSYTLYRDGHSSPDAVKYAAEALVNLLNGATR